MRSALAGVLVGAIILAMSAGVAHADPDVFLTASQAHAGDAIQFSISDVDDRVKYEVEVADRDVLKGEAEAADDDVTISAQFTMPDLGPSPKSVTVEIEARDDDGTTTVKRKIQYLGRAPVVVTPPDPAPASAAPAEAPAPAPAKTPDPVPGPAKAGEPESGKRKSSQRKRGRARKRRASKRIHESGRNRPRTERRRTRPTERESAKEQPRKKKDRPRTAPLFNGVPEADTGGAQAGDDGLSKARRAKPPAAVAVSPVASREGDEPAVAILVPGVLALAGFLLAGATLLRRRRYR